MIVFTFRGLIGWDSTLKPPCVCLLVLFVDLFYVNIHEQIKKQISDIVQPLGCKSKKKWPLFLVFFVSHLLNTLTVHFRVEKLVNTCGLSANHAAATPSAFRRVVKVPTGNIFEGLPK